MRFLSTSYLRAEVRAGVGVLPCVLLPRALAFIRGNQCAGNERTTAWANRRLMVGNSPGVQSDKGSCFILCIRLQASHAACATCSWWLAAAPLVSSCLCAGFSCPWLAACVKLLVQSSKITVCASACNAQVLRPALAPELQNRTRPNQLCCGLVAYHHLFNHHER